MSVAKRCDVVDPINGFALTLPMLTSHVCMNSGRVYYHNPHFKIYSRAPPSSRMQANYEDYAHRAKSLKEVNEMNFIEMCTYEVSIKQFGLDHVTLRFLLAAHLLPEFATVPYDVLVKARLLPFGNMSEAWAVMTEWGLTSREVLPMKYFDGSYNLRISLRGLEKCAKYLEELETILDHAECIMNAYEAYAECV